MDTTSWGFHDLHSFKAYVGFVGLCAPDRFPVREYLEDDEQFTLDRAFQGLRLGLALAVEEKGDRPVFRDCARLVEEAYEQYLSGDKRSGYSKMAEIKKLLAKVPTY